MDVNTPITSDRPGPVLARPIVTPTVTPTVTPMAVPIAVTLVSPVRRSRREQFSLVSEWMFGVAALTGGLAVLASVPFGQFLALGYLLEVSGRVARTGRLRDGFVGVRKAARLGGIAAGLLLCWLPLWGVSWFAASAQIIDPNGPAARQWEIALTTLATLFLLHVSAALLRGGRFRYFLSPFNVLWITRRIRRGQYWRDARDGVWNTVVGLRLTDYFWLGLRGFAGAFAWLVIPLTLLGLGHRQIGVGILGAILLAVVVLYLPFLQTRFARSRKLREFLRVGAVRADFRRAPVAYFLALLVHLLFAVPLYLLKIEVIPRDLVFLEGFVFLLFMIPARFVTGWAVARGSRHRAPRHWFFRWSARLLMLPVVAGYVFVVFTSQHLGWHGIPSLYEQHAFLLPVPFVDWGE